MNKQNVHSGGLFIYTRIHKFITKRGIGMRLSASDLKEIRKYFAINQSQLAQKLGVTQSYIAHMERNAAPVPIFIADKLGITPELLEEMKRSNAERMTLFKINTEVF